MPGLPLPLAVGPWARGHARGKGNQTTKPPSGRPPSPASRPPHLRFPSRHFLLLPPPRCVRGPLNSPSRSGCLARDIPGTHFSASPALFPVPGPHLSDRPFFRFSSRPLPLRRISSCPISFLLSSLLASDQPLPSIQGLQARPPPQRPPNNRLVFAPSSELVCFSLDHPQPLRPSHVPIPIATRIQVPNVVLCAQSRLDLVSSAASCESLIYPQEAHGNSAPLSERTSSPRNNFLAAGVLQFLSKRQSLNSLVQHPLAPFCTLVHSLFSN